MSVDGCFAKIANNANWVVLVDTILQVSILSDPHRSLLVPVHFQSIKFNPDNIKIRSPEELLTVHHDPILKLIWVDDAVIIRYDQFNLLNKKEPSPIIEKYIFIENDANIFHHYLNNFLNETDRLSKILLKKFNNLDGIDKLEEIYQEEDEVGRNENWKFPANINLHEILSNDNDEILKMLQNYFLQNEIDLFSINKIFELEQVIRPIIDIVIENLPKKIFVYEITFYPENKLSESIMSIINNSFFNLNSKYLLGCPNINAQINGIDTILWNPLENIYPACKEKMHFTIYKHPFTDFDRPDSLDLNKLVNYFHDITKENGFLLAIFRTNSIPCENTLHKLLDKGFDIWCDNIFIEKAMKNGFQLIAKRTYSIYYSIILMRKTLPKYINDQIFINIRTDTFEPWINSLKTALKECETKPMGHNIWLISTDSPHNGVVGLVNCLRREPNGERIRCLLVCDKTDETFDSTSYSRIIAKDLVMNVIKDGKCGTYKHLSCSEELGMYKVVPVWEFPKMTSREFPGISRFFGKTRAGNGKSHIENFAPKL